MRTEPFKPSLLCWCRSFDDDSGTTVRGYVWVNSTDKYGHETIEDIEPFTGYEALVNLSVDQANGNSYTTYIEAQRAGQTNISYQLENFFKKSPVDLAGFDQMLKLWIAMGSIIFTAMFGGVKSGNRVALLACFIAWVFWSIGWLDPLNLYIPMASDAAIPAVLAIASVLALVFLFSEAKKDEKARGS